MLILFISDIFVTPQLVPILKPTKLMTLLHVFSSILQFIFSTALDGKIKAWLYDNLGSRVDYDAPGRWCTTMAYSADGSRFLYFVIWFHLEYMHVLH